LQEKQEKEYKARKARGRKVEVSKTARIADK
jgi:hypothetical protein